VVERLVCGTGMRLLHNASFQTATSGTHLATYTVHCGGRGVGVGVWTSTRMSGVRVGRRLPAESETDLPLRTVLLVVASVFMCLVIGAVAIWQQPRMFSTMLLLLPRTVIARCSTSREVRDLTKAPRDKMACVSAPGHLRDSVNLPMVASVGVAVNGEKDPDTVRLIAELRRAGYIVPVAGGIRRVVFPSSKNGS
jgi:hypothetical protein